MSWGYCLVLVLVLALAGCARQPSQPELPLPWPAPEAARAQDTQADKGSAKQSPPHDDLAIELPYPENTHGRLLNAPSLGKPADTATKLVACDAVDAQFQLAMMHYHGEGVPKDAEKAAVWFRRAAERGVSEARRQVRAFEARRADQS